MDTTTISKPKVQIDAAIKALIKSQSEKCTIVHCEYKEPGETLLRIWPSTFLVEKSGKRCKLIKAFNISVMPQWTYFDGAEIPIKFTLVFEGLGRGCEWFHLIEDIPQPGGFYTERIHRNKTDVYEVEIKVGQ